MYLFSFFDLFFWEASHQLICDRRGLVSQYEDKKLSEELLRIRRLSIAIHVFPSQKDFLPTANDIKKQRQVQISCSGHGGKTW